MVVAVVVEVAVVVDVLEGLVASGFVHAVSRWSSQYDGSSTPLHVPISGVKSQ